MNALSQLLACSAISCRWHGFSQRPDSISADLRYLWEQKVTMGFAKKRLHYKVIPHLPYYLCANLSCAAKVDGENDSSFF